MRRFKLRLIILLVALSCKNSDDILIEEPEVIELSDEVEIFESDKVERSLVFAIPLGSDEAFILDKTGKKIKEWSFDKKLGNDLELLPDGKLIGLFKPEDRPVFSFGGYGGIVKILNVDGSVFWEYNYHSPNYLAHHDVELLPNGNVLFLAWERVTAGDAQALGIDVAYDIYPESLIEVNIDSNEIVWEWHSIDHIIQDVDNSLPNFGQINEHPERINHSYALRENGDIMHANGIDYDIEKDVIYMSVNFYSEVWVIDHSTSKEESASSSGGNYNRGGELVYRFGNPEAYSNIFGSRLFYKNHSPNYLQMNELGAGNIIVYMNGTNNDQSIIYELKIPENFNLKIDSNNEPEIIWSFLDPELFNGIVSGAVRLKNGNTLICEGDYGFWEVTPDKEVVWKYNGDVKFWRAYSYLPSDSAILSLGI